MNSTKNLNRITHDIIKVAFDVRNQYGRLMLESLYEQVFAIELTMLGYKVERQVPLDIVHKGITIKRAYVIDMLVEDMIPLELKARTHMGGEEFRQLLTYLKLADKPVGFLINFGAKEFSFGKMHEEDGKHLHGLYRLIN